MLSYRHGYHAGNWADVHKHVALWLLVDHLRAKDRPFCVVDVFAGDGMYDLGSEEARKNAEFEGGIGRIWRRTDAPGGVAGYLDIVCGCNAQTLSAYPGSPAIVRAMLRDGDRLIADELHPAGHARLKAWARGDARIAIHRRDGLEFLGAAVPPAVRRGLVLVDPSYEVKAEYETVPAAVARAVRKWPTGNYMVWYPVLREGRHRALVAALTALAVDDWLVSELAPPEPPAKGMLGSGLAVLNPPWKFDERLDEAASWLAAAVWPDGPGRHDLRHSV